MSSGENGRFGALRTASAALLMLAPIAAQRIENLSQGLAVREAWKPVVEQAMQSVVEVSVDGDLRALGTVVAPGLLVTKFSELRIEPRLVSVDGGIAADVAAPPRVTCAHGESSWTCTLLGRDQPSDLALLRFDGVELPVVAWQDQVPATGAFLATPGTSGAPIGVGVLSARVYRHTRQRAFLGVRFASADGAAPPALDEVVPNAAAAAAGLLAGDLVVTIDGSAVATAEQLRTQLRLRAPGDRVRLGVKRGEQDLDLEAVLGTDSSPMRSDQERLWGELSDVRSGFDDVLQHDTVLEPIDCGGPLVDLEGKVVGVNIARAGRVESLALPAAVVRGIVVRLRAAEVTDPARDR